MAQPADPENLQRGARLLRSLLLIAPEPLWQITHRRNNHPAHPQVISTHTQTQQARSKIAAETRDWESIDPNIS
uniref:Uncharacterized protein n=1 Tax=Candidozyma auris TaxID=498019 RepID=A0A0L0P222_CANAR